MDQSRDQRWSRRTPSASDDGDPRIVSEIVRVAERSDRADARTRKILVVCACVALGLALAAIGTLVLYRDVHDHAWWILGLFTVLLLVAVGLGSLGAREMGWVEGMPPKWGRLLEDYEKAYPREYEAAQKKHRAAQVRKSVEAVRDNTLREQEEARERLERQRARQGSR
jgi:hypothetical protein